MPHRKRRDKDPMELIRMQNPIAELDGDEMTRIVWKQIKEELLLPFLELKTEYYDLGLENREKTGDQVTIEASEAIKRLGVGVKCATITPNAQRMKEYGLTRMWKSPNGTIRFILDGTVFRKPILVPGIAPLVSNWKKPITIARHAFGDIYRSAEYMADRPGHAELSYKDQNGETVFTANIAELSEGDVIMGQFNTERSIRSFAESCFRYAVNEREDLWFSAKDTISKIYDQRFRDIFEEGGVLLSKIGIAAFLIFMLVTVFHGYFMQSPYAAVLSGSEILRRAGGVLTAWALVFCCTDGKKEPKGFMGINFFIYAVHYLIIRGVNMLLPESLPALFAAYMAMPFICTAVPYGISLILRRFLPKIYLILCGGRQ